MATITALGTRDVWRFATSHRLNGSDAMDPDHSASCGQSNQAARTSARSRVGSPTTPGPGSLGPGEVHMAIGAVVNPAEGPSTAGWRAFAPARVVTVRP
jgi:hypothetical protein